MKSKLLLFTLTMMTCSIYSDIKSQSSIGAERKEASVDELDFFIKVHKNSDSHDFSPILHRAEIIIDMKFKNLSDKTLKLLNMFEPAGVFLTINITAEDGRIIQVLRASKADFPLSQSFEYIDILKGRTYEKQLNLSSILKDNHIRLSAGKYKLAIAYHNQYGKPSIKGWFNSNLLDLIVGN